MTDAVTLDHLVYAVSDLHEGIETFRARLGVAPRLGGRHEGMGTHNAILPLRELQYVELIAPDPDAPDPGRPRPFGLDRLEAPRLVTWAVRSRAIEATALRAKERGYDAGAVFEMSRATPDGETLRWKLCLPTDAEGDGLVPFVIDWGDTRHPAVSQEGAASCPLEAFTAFHPRPDAIREALAALGARLEIRTGPVPRLEAVLSGPAGRLELH